MLIEVICSGPAQTNSILLACMQTKNAAIIDAPLGSGEVHIKRIDSLGLELKMLLLTHTHWDHTADMAFLKEKFKVPLYVHELDALNLRKPGSDLLPLLFDIKRVEPDYFLQDGQQLQLGELTIEVIHTPGHSPGGVCFYLRQQSVLISGDTLFQGTIGNISFPTSEPAKMWESLTKLSKLPANTRVIPGHGMETTIGAEEWLGDAKNLFNY